MLRNLPLLLLPLLTVALTSSTTHARPLAFSCGSASAVTPIVEGNGKCTGFEGKTAGGRTVRVEGYEMSGVILASPDGRSVVMLQTNPVRNEFSDAMPALIVFRDGKELASYSMKDVIGRMGLVTETSHIHWLQPFGSTTLGKTLVLTTRSQRRHEVDLATGKLTSDDTGFWKKCELIVAVTGELTPDKGMYSVTDAWLAKGAVNGARWIKQLQFVAATRIPKDTGYGLCLVSDKRGGWRAIDTIAVGWDRISEDQ